MFGVIVATNLVFVVERTFVGAVTDRACFLFDFLLVGPFETVLCGFGFVAAPVFFRFGERAELPVAFLFVPPGVVTIGTVAKPPAGDIIRSLEMLVEETTLAAFRADELFEDSTFWATPTDGCSLLESGNITVRLLNEVDGRKAPNPSSSVPFSAEPKSDGISVPIIGIERVFLKTKSTIYLVFRRKQTINLKFSHIVRYIPPSPPPTTAAL